MTTLPSSTLPRTRTLWWTDPVVVAFMGYPVLWALGAGIAVWPLAGILATLSLATSSRPTRIPPPLFWWLAFVGWMLLTAVTLTEPDRAVAFAYRATLYLSATALFLYVYNTDATTLPSRTVMRSMTVLWMVTVVAGVVGALAPNLEFTSLVEAVLPGGATSNDLIRANVHLDFAAISFIGDRVIGRPVAPYTYTNAWGSNLALLFPAALAARRMQARPGYRWLVGGLAVVAIFPIIASLNRGMWISLVVGVLVVAMRFAAQGDTRSLTAIFVMGVVTVGALAVTDLDGVITDRANAGHSDRGRLALYEDAIAFTAESPLVGYGTPVPRPGSEGTNEANVGTHGQFWLLLVSHGVPGMVFYIGFMVHLILRMRRWRTELGVICQAIVIMSLLQTLVYEQLPSQLHVVMVIGALSMRTIDRGSVPAPVRELRSPSYAPTRPATKAIAP